MLDLLNRFLQTPLFSVILTLATYFIALAIAKRFQFNPLVNPVVLAVAMIVGVLHFSQITYADYFSGAQLIHFLLGPATVAMAIPLAKQVDRLRRVLLPLGLSLLLGSVTSIVSAFSITALMHGSRELAIAMGPKSATTPIAMAIAEKLGGIPSVSAVVVITTGIIGAMVGRFVFNRIGVTSTEVRGFALGVSAHGIGTARAFQMSSTMGSYAGLGMGLNGIMTAILTPLLVPILLRLFYS